MKEEKLRSIIEDHVNPVLLEHDGWIELVELNDRVATVRFRGACSSCPVTHTTLNETVIPALRKHAPQIKEVKIDEDVSQELYDLAQSLLSRKKKPSVD